MSAERDLLRKVLEKTQYMSYECNNRIRNEIEEFLAQPAQDDKTTYIGEAQWMQVPEPLSADKIWSFSHLLFFDAMRQLEKEHGIGDGK